MSSKSSKYNFDDKELIETPNKNSKISSELIYLGYHSEEKLDEDFYQVQEVYKNFVELIEQV
jgi:hypothetical protein